MAWLVPTRQLPRELPASTERSGLLVAVQQRARIDQHLVVAGPARRPAARAAAGAGQSRPPRCRPASTATSRVGKSWPGSEPLPICEKPSTTAAVAPGSPAAIAAAIRSACASISARPRPSIRSVGTSRSARASSRNSASVASSAASVSLPTRTIRASGFLRTASIQAAPGRG